MNLKKILVIEDHQGTREAILMTLKQRGFKVIGTSDGHAGIEAARAERPDLVICDIRMPGLDGYQTLAELRKDEETAEIPFIFLTGEATRMNQRRGMELGADDYLTKPFTPSELLAAIATRLEKLEREKRAREDQLDSLKNALSRSVPHELRTSLGGILGMTELMIEGGDQLKPSEVGELLKDTRSLAKRLEHVCDNFWYFSRLEVLAADLDRKAETREVRSIVESAAREAAGRAGRDADLVLDLHEVGLRVAERHLRKIVSELVDNALKFSEPGTQVEVRIRHQSAPPVLEVRDRGRGMTATQISAIGPYVQHERQQHEQPGLGLGLFISKRLAELHGGSLQIVSGKGTTVRVVLPSASAPASDQPAAHTG